jgi:hypothetical protein
MKKLIPLAALAAFVIASPVFAADPVVGTWKLNVTKSKFSSAQAPTAITRVYSESKGLYALDITTTGSDGKITSIHVVYREGKEEKQPSSGPEITVLAAKRLDNNTWDFDVKQGGKVTGHVHRVVSADGKTLTVHNSGTLVGGTGGDETLVFDKQ